MSLVSANGIKQVANIVLAYTPKIDNVILKIDSKFHAIDIPTFELI